MIRRLININELTTLEQAWGRDAIDPARAILDQAGIVHITHVVQGEIAPTIIRLAAELECDQIIMGSHGRTGISGLLMGSVASKVMHLTSIPITFIK